GRRLARGRKALLHLSYSSAPPEWTALVTHDPQRTNLPWGRGDRLFSDALALPDGLLDLFEQRCPVIGERGVVHADRTSVSPSVAAERRHSSRFKTISAVGRRD